MAVRACSPPIFPAVRRTAPHWRGFSYAPRSRSTIVGAQVWEVSSVPERVVLFMDYQNVYSGARRAFHGGSGPGRLGQVWPRAVGDLICGGAQQSSERLLEQVRVYRGIPSPSQNRIGNVTSRRQIAAWQAVDKVRVFPHTLLRTPDGRLREKGVDVHLAADLVDGAHRGFFDVGVVFSLDSDFKPAIEIVRDIGVVVEVAAWRSGKRDLDRRLMRNEGVWCHWLNEADYHRVRDRVSYTPPG